MQENTKVTNKVNIRVAQNAGFCFGVERAIELAKNNAPIRSYGKLIHNKNVTDELEKIGVNVINDLNKLKSDNIKRVLVRSHGISRDEYNTLKEHNIQVVDATCPFVKKIHDIVSDTTKDIIIIGDKTHPEVKGIVGWCNSNYYVIDSEDDIKMLDKSKEYILVAQTTSEANKFYLLIEKIKQNNYNVDIYNTICSATKLRQDDSLKLAKESDIMIVIGDRDSSNTMKLYRICKNICNNTYYIQSASDLNRAWFEDKSNIGITAGASTPNNIIQEVLINVRNFF